MGEIGIDLGDEYGPVLEDYFQRPAPHLDRLVEVVIAHAGRTPQGAGASHVAAVGGSRAAVGLGGFHGLVLTGSGADGLG